MLLRGVELTGAWLAPAPGTVPVDVMVTYAATYRALMAAAEHECLLAALLAVLLYAAYRSQCWILIYE